MFNKITEKDIKFLKEVFGDNKCFVGDEIAHEYSKDEMGTIVFFPEVRVIAKDKYQVSKLMKYAYENNIPVTTRGAGTGLVGGAVPVHGGVLLDVTGMDKIVELDHTNMTLRVEPGVLMLDIYEIVLKNNLFYGPDPGEKTATIGGTISTNAGGMRAIKYGTTREWVRDLEIVLPNGEIIKVAGKVVKNSSGYPLKELFIGTEGTLGVIVEATLKLTSLPKHSTSLLVPFLKTSTAVKAAADLIEKHVTPTAVEYVNQPSLEYSKEFLGKHMPHDNYDAYLLLSYDGTSKEALAKDIERASELCIELGAIDVYLIDTAERNASVWTIRGAFLEAIKSSTPLMDELDVVVPRSMIPDYLEFTEQVSKKLDIRMPFFGHVGDGNLHIYFCKDQMSQEEFDEKLIKAFDLMYDKAFSMGGLVSGEHGVGYAKKEYLARQIGPVQLELMKGIKKLFDPKNILNPDKIV